MEIASALSKLTGFSHRPTTIDKATAPHRYLHIAMPFGKHIGNRCRCYCQSPSCSSNFARICQLKIISITPFKNMSFQNNGSPLFQNIAKIMKRSYIYNNKIVKYALHHTFANLKQNILISHLLV